MASNQTITAELREDAGKGASRRLRRAGLIPGILYGAGRPPRNIQLNHNEVILAARKESFFSSILDLDFNGKKQPVLVRDWQTHPFRQQMLHLDFMRVREDEEIRVSIPLHFLNEATSPAGKSASVVISRHLSDVEVSCLPADLPEYLEVDLGTLEEGGVVHLSAIKLPEGVKLTALMHEDEANDQVLVTAQQGKEEVEEPVEGEAAEDTHEASDEAADESSDDSES